MKLRPSLVQAPQVPQQSAAPIPDALRNFDSLPEAANVRLPVVAALFACSSATVWRRVKSGTLPAPRKLSEGVTAWRVAELRKALSGEAWQ
jgi:predicted DNA-binding transcriptional regulator AlpA